MNITTRAHQRRVRKSGLRFMVIAMASTMVWLLSGAPATSQTIPPSNVGFGVVQGLVTFDDGATLPPGGETCDTTSWTFEGTADPGFALNTVITGYVGPITITAEGGAECENAESGSGELTLTASGDGPTGSEVDCPPAPDPGDPENPPLSGTFQRVGSTVLVDVRGACEVNNFGIASVRFISTGEFIPSDADGIPAVGPGVTEHVKYATYTGIFTIATV